VAHTRAARERLGDAPLLAPELAGVVDDDVQSGRASARRYAGADDVCLQAAGVTGIPRSEWTALAAALALGNQM
jgi:hypothetical protein